MQHTYSELLCYESHNRKKAVFIQAMLIYKRDVNNTHLLRYLDKCIETIVDGGVGDSIYLDIAKPYDTMPIVGWSSSWDSVALMEISLIG